MNPGRAMMRENAVVRFSKSTAARVMAGKFGLIESARRVYIALTARHSVRRALHLGRRHAGFDKARAKSCADASPLAQLTVQILELAKAGASRSDLQQIALHVQSAIDRARPVPRSVDALDLADVEIDAQEERVQGRRRIRGASPAARLEEARLLRESASVNIELAEALESDVYGGSAAQHALALA
jgi:hypothetical protein